MNGTQALNQMYSSLIETPAYSGALEKEKETNSENKTGFSTALNQAIGSLENKQFEANEAVQALAEGKADDMHSVMIKTTEAQLSLELAVQMRNKVLEAYNEIKNMQF